MTISTTRIRCVMFDAVGTLIHPEPSVGDVYRSVAGKYGGNVSVAETRQRFRDVMSHRLSATTSEDAEREFWRKTVRAVVGEVEDADGCFEELHAHFARPQSWRVASAAAATLHRLHEQGIRLGMASNFDQRLLHIAAGLPPLNLCDPVIVSSQVGWRKPHPEFFQALLERLDLQPFEVLMIGDDFENDIRPARLLGMQAIHLVEHAPASTNPDQDTIHSLTEVLSRMKIHE